MGYKVTHGRMKEKYNPNPNASERAFESHLSGLPCYGCGGPCHVRHHTRLEFTGKRWRRDHRWQLPLCNPCHKAAHDVREHIWLQSIAKTPEHAIAYMKAQWDASQNN
jgi:hypothetical protein